MRKFFQHYLPNSDTVKQNRWLRPFGAWLAHPNLWHLHRRSVAGGVAVGLFCGLIPGPLQMIGSALLAVLFRVNLPVALITTLYTNPFTIVPLYAVAYELGAWVSGARSSASVEHLALPEMHWSSWPGELWAWFQMLGKPLLIGLPLLAIGLAIIGYFAVRVAWRVAVLLRWRARKRRNKDFMSSTFSPSIATIRNDFALWFDMAESFNDLGLRVLPAVKPDQSSNQQLLAAALYGRILTSFQAAYTLAERGMLADARTVVRAAAETTIVLSALVKDASVCDLLLDRHY